VPDEVRHVTLGVGVTEQKGRMGYLSLVLSQRVRQGGSLFFQYPRSDFRRDFLEHLFVGEREKKYKCVELLDKVVEQLRRPVSINRLYPE
jgi:hypothetical protein